MTVPAIDTRWLDDLKRDVLAHPAVNHLLLARAATHPYTRSDYKVFGLHHHALVGFFTRYMEILLVRASSSAEKLWLAKVLVDEYGEGSDGHDHATLYRQFLRHAGARAREEFSVALCPEVFEFVREHVRIVSEEPFFVGLGALGPGHEWAIPKMFSHLIPGLRRAGFSDDQINYFLLHCEQDIDHGAWMREVLATQCVTAEDRARVRDGAMRSLSARYRLWTGIERSIVAWRQPMALEAAKRGLVGTLKKVVVKCPGKLQELRVFVDRAALSAVGARSMS